MCPPARKRFIGLLTYAYGEGAMFPRMFLSINHGLAALLWSMALGVGLSSCSQCTRIEKKAEQQQDRMTVIYGQADWYLARAEPEKAWRGVLRERQVTVGPATRTALAYALVTDEGDLPVYSAQLVATLAPFVGRQVLVRGKLVNLSSEGAGEELWIATIQFF